MFKVKGSDQSETDGWEIIGWDPDRQQIRSWIFDSNGGFGESTWANDGEHWLIQAANFCQTVVTPPRNMCSRGSTIISSFGNRRTAASGAALRRVGESRFG
jgi:hypothetical protein